MRVGDILLERYEIVGTVGEGAMGTVFRAVDRTGGGVVAIKRPHADIGETAGLVGRFEREASAQAMLVHPNIATQARRARAEARAPRTENQGYDKYGPPLCGLSAEPRNQRGGDEGHDEEDTARACGHTKSQLRQV